MTNYASEQFRKHYGEHNVGNVHIIESAPGKWLVALPLDGMNYSTKQAATSAARVWQSAVDQHMRKTLPRDRVNADPGRYDHLARAEHRDGYTPQAISREVAR